MERLTFFAVRLQRPDSAAVGTNQSIFFIFLLKNGQGRQNLDRENENILKMFKLRNFIQDILAIEYFEKDDLPCFPSKALNECFR